MIYGEIIISLDIHMMMMMMKWFLLVLLLLCSCNIIIVSSLEWSYVVKSKGGQYEVSKVRERRWIARGSLEGSAMDDGFPVLRIESSGSASDEEQMYASGYVEGVLTKDMILDFHRNTKQDHDDLRDELREFMSVQDKYLRDSAKEKGDEDPFWKEIGLTMKQLDGLVDGFNSVLSNGEDSLDKEEFWILNMDGDVIELETALRESDVDVVNTPCRSTSEETKGSYTATTTTTSETDEEAGLRFQSVSLQTRWKDRLLKRLSSSSSLSNKNRIRGGIGEGRVRRRTKTTIRRNEDPQEKFLRLMKKARCTALVKIVEDDIYVGHNSWEDYSEMLRIYKHYRIRTKQKDSVGRMSFSSYPGMLSSTDDFYITGASLAIIETTVNLMNDELLGKMCAKGGVASWVRSMVANRLAHDAKKWTDLYSRENSGTYNCQWMVVDYKVPQNQPNRFWVLETIPGFEHAEDMSQTLRDRGYWPSANRPYFPGVRSRAGYGNNEDSDSVEMGLPLKCPDIKCDMLSFEDNPRGASLRRLANPEWSKENALKRMKDTLRHNGWKVDPETTDPSLAIASRYDLVEGLSKTPTGAVDGKITNGAAVKQMKAWIVAGPTKFVGGRDDAVFDWDAFPGVRHDGMPERWDFDWKETGWEE